VTRYFHTTDAAAEILQDGFRDATGSYMLRNHTLTGVFIADTPLDINEGAAGEALLSIELPDTVDLAAYELVEAMKPYREWCVPAELINTHGRLQLIDPDEAFE
jgi:hypothetical protein